MPSAYALLALAQLAVGAAAIFARFALAGGGPIAVSALRLLIAAVPVAAFAALRGAYRRHDAATERRLVFAGCALAAHFALWIASLRFAGVGVSTLLVCTTPIWTELFEIIRTRRVRRNALASIGLAIAGVAAVVGVPTPGQTPLGIGLALGGAIAIAIYLVLVRASDPRYETLAIVGRTYPIAAIVLLAAATLTRDRVPPLHATGAWCGIIAMALVSQLFGHTALNVAVRTLSATFVATVTLIEPAIAASLAAVIFGEHLAPGTLAGSLLVLAGIGVAVFDDHRNAVKKSPEGRQASNRVA
jgi:drug/metabolite transporter (DMT)-like permease